MFNYLELNLIIWALLAIRFLMLPLIVYNLGWSFRGFINFVNGKEYPACLYESLVFFMSLGLSGYHLMYFIGRTSSDWSLPYSLALQCLFFLASLVAFIGRRLSITLNFQKFYWLFESNNLEVAVRMAHLNQLDPDFAKKSLEAAESSMVLHLAKRK